MKNNSDMIKAMAKKADASLVKAKDLPLFNKVKDFLNQRGLEFEVRGSVVENSLNAHPRQYHDVDIVVKNDGSKSFKDAYMNLLRTKNNVDGDYNRAELAQYIESHSNEDRLYADHNIDQTFNLKDGKTSIELCFQAPRREDSNIIQNPRDFFCSYKYDLILKKLSLR